MTKSFLVTVAMAMVCYTVGWEFIQQISFEVNTKLSEEHKLGLFSTNKHLSCARLCFSFSGCKSIVFHQDNRTCILNDVDSSSVNHLEFENTPGVVYSDISSWSSDIAGSCRLHACPYYQMCLPTGNTSACREIDCGNPPRVKFGNINITSTKFGPDLNVRCFYGYKLGDPSSIRCYADGHWSEKPVCKPVDCGVPYVEYSTNSFVSTTYRTTIEVVCVTGYELNGSPNIICGANGQWSVTRCVLIDCGDPGILNSVYSTNITTYGTIVDISCDVGYDLFGMRVIQCQGDATWSARPKCMPKECGYPKISYSTLHGSTINGTDTTYNSTLIVVCDDNAILVGEPAIVCQASGVWSTLPKCIQDCGDPGILNGVYSTNITTYGTIVDITCDVGYDLFGMRTIQCQADATWSTKPKCMPKDCGYPAISSSTFDGTDTTYNSTLMVMCNDNYTLVGDSEIVCQSNGAWSPLPECIEVVCFNATCFRLYPGMRLKLNSYCNTAFWINVIKEKECISFCEAEMPLFVSMNYNPSYKYCRCLDCSLEHYLAAGLSYNSGSNYDLYVLIQ